MERKGLSRSFILKGWLICDTVQQQEESIIQGFRKDWHLGVLRMIRVYESVQIHRKKKSDNMNAELFSDVVPGHRYFRSIKRFALL